ncbi:MAG TPA: hypothetical protein VNH11_32095 [Pirellulales bacterium]|nr:hypothetical protein [Pirellulales bacterium]
MGEFRQPDSDENPFAPPVAAVAGGLPATVEQRGDRTPFALQAVRFSLYAPVLLTATNLFLRASAGANHPGTKAFAVVSLLTIVAALFLGIVGMVGSLRRRAIWSAFLGLFGTLVNGVIVAGVIGSWTLLLAR